ncbi:hypothetical protein BV898_19626 [Hypsibius exemplaris]|uniref:Kazal-like domain-containing protein n=1 Tax=Hypsibius exemplaris TaxID=2072580 RepID=A0A9X6NLZ9_HYPEX|nr:hypothetical protein BV898_19626 [Hypsibius exemplaris]
MRLLLILLVGIIAAVSSNNVPILRKQLDEALDKVADLTRQLNGIIGILEDTPASCSKQCPNYPLIDMNQVVEVTGPDCPPACRFQRRLVSLDFAASQRTLPGRCLAA